MQIDSLFLYNYYIWTKDPFVHTTMLSNKNFDIFIFMNYSFEKYFCFELKDFISDLSSIFLKEEFYKVRSYFSPIHNFLNFIGKILMAKSFQFCALLAEILSILYQDRLFVGYDAFSLFSFIYWIFREFMWLSWRCQIDRKYLKSFLVKDYQQD